MMMNADDKCSYVTYPCVRAVLLLFNIAFWFCGLAIVWAGIWLQTELQNYFKISEDFSKAAPLALVSIGTIMIFVATLACTCIVKVQQTMLVIYGGFLIIILFTVITLSAYIYTYKDQLSAGLASGIRHDIRHYNQPQTNHTKVIDFIQRKLHCCGSESYHDWSISPSEIAPESCCATPLGKCNPEDPTTLFQIGCTSELKKLVNANLTVIGSTSSAIALLPLFGAILTFCLAAASRKYEYEPII